MPTHRQKGKIDTYTCRHQGVVKTHVHTRTHTYSRYTHTRLLMKVVPSQKEGAGFPHWLMTHWGSSCRCLCIITCYAVLPLILHYCRRSYLRSPMASQSMVVFKITKWKVLTPMQRHVGIQMSCTPHPDIWHKDKRTPHKLQRHCPVQYQTTNQLNPIISTGLYSTWLHTAH